MLFLSFFSCSTISVYYEYLNDFDFLHPFFVPGLENVFGGLFLECQVHSAFDSSASRITSIVLNLCAGHALLVVENKLLTPLLMYVKSSLACF